MRHDPPVRLGPSRRIAVLLLSALIVASGCQKKAPPPPILKQYLYVWTGDVAQKAPDALAVIDFTDSSPDYGKVLTTVPLAGPGSAGNEPRGMALSHDGNVLACAGALGGVRGQNDVFFFDVTNAKAPKPLEGADPPLSSVAGNVCPLDSGGFFVTLMCGPKGTGPGRVAEFDASRRLVGEFPSSPPDDRFNPLGISIRPDLNLMVTSDFLFPPGGSGTAKGEVAQRSSVRIWDLARRQVVRTIPIGKGVGTVDVQLIPGDSFGRAYTAGIMDNKLYLIDTSGGTAKPVFDFSQMVPDGRPQLLRLNRDGTRLYVTLSAVGKVVMLDTSNPETPTVLKGLGLGADSGAHDLFLTPDETRLVITNYSWGVQGRGDVPVDGDQRIRVADLSEYDIELDQRFLVYLSVGPRTGLAWPRGAAVKQVEEAAPLEP